MAQIFTVADDGTIVIDKLALKYTSGSVVHSGFLNVTGNAQIDSNLVVQGNITAKVINVDSIVTSNGSLAAAGQWTYNTDAELNGKGFSWSWGEGSTQLIYRAGGRLWTNATLDVSGLSIDNIPVITSSSLGSTIAYSNLSTVGTLNSLAVSGDTTLAEFFFVDSTANRIGIGTDEPNTSLSILDNNVEIGIGSPKTGLGTVGTFSSHDFAIVTDNLPRITVKNSGAVNIGDPVNGGGVLNVYGTIYATNIQTSGGVLGGTTEENKDYKVLEDGTLSIEKLVLKYTSGSVVHSGFLNITGNAQIDSNLVVQGTITTNVITANSIVTPNGNLANLGSWIYNTEEELLDKGFSWSWGEGSTRLLYQPGNNLWTNANLTATSYNINNASVLTETTLGSTVVNSSLTSVGTLSSLTVDGATNLNNLTVNGNISLSNINIVSTNISSAYDLTFATDNVRRISIEKTGEINIGTPEHGDAVLNIYGTLRATTVETDNRIERSSPLTFQTTSSNSIYGLGLMWTGTGPTKQLIMMGSPDRLWSSESFDLRENQGYHINGQLVLNSSSLGDGVIHSNLQTVGTLQTLTVSGDTFLSATKASLLVVAGSGSQTYTIDNTAITGSNSVAVKVDTQPVLVSNSNQTVIGDVAQQTKPVKVFGPLSVNINNPDPNVQFSVNGDVVIGGKKFTNGTSAPTTGSYQVGDICWNTAPMPGTYVGWIYISQGQWSGFGMIAS